MINTSNSFAPFHVVLLETERKSKPPTLGLERMGERLLNPQTVLLCHLAPQNILHNTIEESVPIGARDWIKQSTLHYPSTNIVETL